MGANPTIDSPVRDRALVVARRRVRMVDTDAAQLIYYGAVFPWAEELFTTWLAEADHPLAGNLEAGLGFPAVRSEADYRHPLGLGDELELQLRPHHIGQHSFSLETTVYLLPDRREAAKVRVWHVCVEFEPRRGTTTPDVRVVGLPAWVRQALS